MPVRSNAHRRKARAQHETDPRRKTPGAQATLRIPAALLDLARVACPSADVMSDNQLGAALIAYALQTQPAHCGTVQTD